MKRVELRPAARRDMLRFERFLNRQSPRAALRMFDLVTSRVLSLGAEPFKGVERQSDMRELFVKSASPLTSSAIASPTTR